MLQSTLNLLNADTNQVLGSAAFDMSEHIRPDLQPVTHQHMRIPLTECSHDPQASIQVIISIKHEAPPQPKILTTADAKTQAEIQALLQKLEEMNQQCETEKKQLRDRLANTDMQIALKKQAVARLEKVSSDLRQRLDQEKGADEAPTSFFDMLPQKSQTEVSDIHTVSSNESPSDPSALGSALSDLQEALAKARSRHAEVLEEYTKHREILRAQGHPEFTVKEQVQRLQSEIDTILTHEKNKFKVSDF